MVNLALAWAETYQELHPEIRVSVTGWWFWYRFGCFNKWYGGYCQCFKSDQRRRNSIGRNQKDFTPFEQAVASDAIAVIVNPENSVDELSIESDIKNLFGRNHQLAGSRW